MAFYKVSNSRLFAIALALCLTVFPAFAAEKLYPLVIHTKKDAHLFQVEFVNTPETMAQGLMGRETLENDHGMLFLFPKPEKVSFWMRNTLIPLDMIFIKTDGSISSIHENAKPLDETPIPSEEEVIAVLEIPGGQALQRGIKSGHKVETPLLKGSEK